MSSVMKSSSFNEVPTNSLLVSQIEMFVQKFLTNQKRRYLKQKIHKNANTKMLISN